MFNWQPQTIQFMRDASEYSSYYSELAGHMSRFLDKDANVCDAGCGLGYLSLALSQYCRRVTAVDVSAQALAVLSENIVAHGYENIDVVQGDIAECPPNTPYDAMVFCFFGHMDEALSIAKAQCCGKVILVRKNWGKHRFTLHDKPLEHFTLTQMQARLSILGIPFQSESIEFEMGQPFRSMEDAAEFYRIYSDDKQVEKILAADVEEKLKKCIAGEFKYYLPMKKKIGMIVLDAGDIPVTIKTA
ncbi:MAG: class I SAM-dependent methyltransferase [Clostridia bacterium]